MTGRSRLLASAAFAAILFSACGGGDGDATKQTEKTEKTEKTSTPPSTRAALDLGAFVGRWYGAPVDLVIAADGEGMLVFPELAPDGSDEVAMTFLVSEVSAGTASADVQSNEGNTLFAPGQRITLTVRSDTELALDPDGGVFCRPDRSCIPPFE